MNAVGVTVVPEIAHPAGAALRPSLRIAPPAVRLIGPRPRVHRSAAGKQPTMAVVAAGDAALAIPSNPS
jgi:hypothetical protein